MVIVAGSTGVLGFEICRRLRGRGLPVRALVRSTSAPGRVSELRGLGCDIAVGDLKDRRSLDAACAGAEVAVSTVSALTTAKEGDSFAATDGAGNINLVDAAANAGLKQFVFVSFAAEGMPDAPVVDGKRAAEEHLKRSGVVYTILHPSWFMESWLGPMLFADPAAGTAKIYGTRDVKRPYIAVADVAEMVVQCIGHAAARNAVIPFGGPEALSQREAVKVFEETFNKPFAVTEIPEDALEAQWQAAPDPWMRSFAALTLGAARGAAAGGELSAEQFPMKMKTVKEFVAGLRSQ